MGWRGAPIGGHDEAWPSKRRGVGHFDKLRAGRLRARRTRNAGGVEAVVCPGGD